MSVLPPGRLWHPEAHAANLAVLSEVDERGGSEGYRPAQGQAMTLPQESKVAVERELR